MSQENVEVIRTANAMFNAGDWDALSDLYHPEIELRDLQHAPDLPEVLRGRDAVLLLLANWTEVYEEFGADVHDYIDADPWVICDTQWHGIARGSDIPTVARVADAYQVKDGKIIRAINSYPDVATALKAVGREE